MPSMIVDRNRNSALYILSLLLKVWSSISHDTINCNQNLVVANMNKSLPFLLRLDVNKTRFALRATSGEPTNEHKIVHDKKPFICSYLLLLWSPSEEYLDH